MKTVDRPERLMGHHQMDQYMGIRKREKGAERLFEELRDQKLSNLKKRHEFKNPRTPMTSKWHKLKETHSET